MSSVMTYIKDNLLAVAVLAAVAFYGADRLGYIPAHGGNAPQPVVADAIPRQLGAVYKAAVVAAVSGTLDVTAGDLATSSLGATTAAQHDALKARLATAWAPIATEAERRFGTTTLDANPSAVAAYKAFLASVSAGFKGAK